MMIKSQSEKIARNVMYVNIILMDSLTSPLAMAVSDAIAKYQEQKYFKDEMFRCILELDADNLKALLPASPLKDLNFRYVAPLDNRLCPVASRRRFLADAHGRTPLEVAIMLFNFSFVGQRVLDGEQSKAGTPFAMDSMELLDSDNRYNRTLTGIPLCSLLISGDWHWGLVHAFIAMCKIIIQLIKAGAPLDVSNSCSHYAWDEFHTGDYDGIFMFTQQG